MSYTPKHYANVTELTANNLNELELAVSEAHEDIDILQKQMTNLQLDNPEVLKQLNEVLNNTSDAFTLLKDIENAMTEQPDLSAILKQNSANFLTKTSQSLTNTEKKQILKNLGLNKYHFLENIYVNGTQLTGTSLNLTLPTIDTILNKNSNNAISNAVVAEALENIKIPDITPLLTDYATIDFVEKKAFNAITAEMLLRKQGDDDLQKALDTHNHDNVYSKIHDHPYASETHTHDYLPLTGGKMTGPLTWKDGNALPRNESPKFILTIDDFVNGGTTKWVLLNDLKTALGVPTDYASSSHSHNYSYYQKDTIDLSDTSLYDENNYYPCTSKIPVNGLYKLQVAVQLNSGTKPSWSTHGSGFTYNLSALLKANDWGVTNGTMIIFEDTYSHSSVKPGALTQLTNSGNAVLWLRGGGKYFVFKEWEENWSIHTETTEIYSQTIAPTETLPASQGDKVSYASHTHDDYLPLTAGVNKKVTGSFHVDNYITIANGKGYRAYDNSGTIKELLRLSTGNTIILGDANSSLEIATHGTVRPSAGKSLDLGSSTYNWSNIYGTTIYQDGKQVANKEDIPSLEGYATEGYVDTKDTETNNRIDEVENSIPINISELNNDSQFITNTVSNLTYYYTKSQSYTKDEINSLISNIKSFNALIVSSLPTEDISTTTLYLLSKTDSEDNDYYDEYLYINNTWEMIGNTKIDLSNHYTKTEIDTQMENVVTLDGEQALTNKTYEGYTLGAACAKGTTSTVSSSSSSLITSAGVASYLSGKTIITKSDQYIRITDLSTGVYKLTYSGTKYLYYSGTSSTLSCTVVAGTGAVLLYVSRYNSTYWNWFYINGGGTGGFPYIYFGYTSSNGGNYSSKSLSSLLTSANLPYLNNTRMGTSSKFYAPTTGGTSGYILNSNGATAAPTWIDPNTLVVGEATKATQDGNGDIITTTYAKISDIPDTSEFAKTTDLLNYLPKSGGTITGTSGDTPLTVQSASTGSYIGFRNSSGTLLGYYGVNSSKQPVFYDNGDKVLAYASDIPDTSELLKLDGSNTMTGKLNLKSYGSNAGNIGPNGIAWDDTSLPQDTAPQFVCTIDGFANGGRQKWASVATLATAIGLSNYVDKINNQSIAGNKTFTGTTSTMDIHCYSTLRMINGSNNALMWNIITDTNGNLVFKHS